MKGNSVKSVVRAPLYKVYKPLQLHERFKQITNSTKLSPSCEATSSSALQEIPKISWKSQVH
jgi:hypothetical protein